MAQSWEARGPCGLGGPDESLESIESRLPGSSWQVAFQSMVFSLGGGGFVVVRPIVGSAVWFDW